MKTLARQTVEGGEMQIASIRTGKKDITADLTDITTRIIKGGKNSKGTLRTTLLYKFNSLDEMGQFLDEMDQ